MVGASGIVGEVKSCLDNNEGRQTAQDANAAQMVGIFAKVLQQ